MGKAARRAKRKANTAAVPSLDKKLSRVMRRLGLIDSRCSHEEFYRSAETALGKADLEEWMEVSSSDSYDLNYDFQYASVDRALVTSVSWRSWPLEVELRWLLPRLANRLQRVPPEERYLVEIGAGPGAAAAIASTVLDVPVIATDTHPSTLGMAEQLSARTQGSATSVVVDALDVSTVFHDAPPAAIFGLGVFRYVVRHSHQSRVFSYSGSAAKFTKQPPSQKAAEFFRSIWPSDLLLAEQMCEDYLGEIASAALTANYSFTAAGVERLYHQIPGEDSSCVCVHLTCEESEKSPRPPVELLAGELPPVAGGLNVDGLKAEIMRSLLTPVEQLETQEIQWKDDSGTLRREFFRYKSLFGCYRASDVGFRELQLVSRHDESKLRRKIADDEARIAPSERTRRRSIATPSSLW